MADFAKIEQEFEAADDFAQLKLDTQRIIVQIRAVPYGQVASYKEIGNLAGLANGARQVARILHSLSDKYQLPWWRVIRSDKTLGLTGAARAEQIRLLRLENVNVDDLGHVNS
jgi:methylated-DNA-protein-cysteine methyltransferase-like protein